MESFLCLFKQMKLALAVVCMQFGYAVMSILAKFAFNKGMSPQVLVAYRMIVASVLIAPFAIVLERKSRPKMTLAIFAKILILSLLSPVLDQNLFYTGMKITTATFTSAMCNSLPAFAFIMALMFRLEKVKIKKLHSQAKILGTLVSVGGAMLMTLVKGPEIKMRWTLGLHSHFSSSVNEQDPIKGAIMIAIGCFCWSCFIILQAFVIKEYPAKLSLTTLICIASAAESTILALVVERNNTSAWSIHFDIKLLAALYGGLISGGAYYLMGVVVKKKGPVFMSAFNPLGTFFVTIMGVIVLAEKLYSGRIFGAAVIVFGLYMVLWGKSKDQPSKNELHNNLAQNDEQEVASMSGISVNAVDIVRVTPVDEPTGPTDQKSTSVENCGELIAQEKPKMNGVIAADENV